MNSEELSRELRIVVNLFNQWRRQRKKFKPPPFQTRSQKVKENAKVFFYVTIIILSIFLFVLVLGFLLDKFTN